MEDKPKKTKKSQLLKAITEAVESEANQINEPNYEIPEKIEKYYKSEIFGTNSYKRKNFLFLSKSVLIYISGLSFKILNLKTKKEKIFHSISGGGIGCIEIHPSKKYFAIGEKYQNEKIPEIFEKKATENPETEKNKQNIENPENPQKKKKPETPNIYIYSFPSLKLEKTLKNGTERSYNVLTFSQSGSKLASIGNTPDYSLIIWNWFSEIPILRVKAFSQEIYDIQFSAYDENFLISCGMAHIKFWKIAETFTGLKLKGEIGKFGQIELSDISAVGVLEDGKVVSGSENGDLLLWEGNFIKAVLRGKICGFCEKKNKACFENFGDSGKKTNYVNCKESEENMRDDRFEDFCFCENPDFRCHRGNIESLKILYDEFLVTAGEDNFVKIWNIREIENIIEDNEGFGYITPLKIIDIGKKKYFSKIEKILKNNKKEVQIFNEDLKIEKVDKIEDIENMEMDLNFENTKNLEDNSEKIEKNDNLESQHIINIQTQFTEESILFLQNAKGSIISLKFDKSELKEKLKNSKNIKTEKNKDFFENEKKNLNSENNNIFKKKIIHEFPAGKIVSTSFYEEKVYLGYSEGICLEFDKNEKTTKSRKLDFYGISSISNFGQNLLIGNKKGVLTLFSENFKKLDFLKVFDQPLTQILIEDNFIICMAKNEIFVLTLNLEKKKTMFKGEFLYKIEKTTISSISLKNKNLFIGLQNGEIRKIDVLQIDPKKNEKNYQIKKIILNEKKGILKMAEFQKPKQDEDDIKFVLNDKIEEIDIEWDSLCIRSILCYEEESEIPKNSENEENFEILKKSRFGDKIQKNKFLTNFGDFEEDERVLVSSEGDFIGFVYLIKLSAEMQNSEENLENGKKNGKIIIRPIRIIKTRKKIISKMVYAKNEEKAIFGYEDGILEIRNKKNLEEIFIRTFGHDKINGSIFYINADFERNCLFSVGNDCSLVFYDLEKKMENEYFGFEKIFFEEKIEEFLSDFENFDSCVKGYSLQQEKIQAVEDKKLKNSELYKKNLRAKICKIQEKFFLLKRKNEDLEDFYKLNNEDLIFDNNFHNFLIKKKNNKILEAEKEVEYEKEICKMKVEKIKKFYFSDISCKSFGVSKISSKNFVFSIKLKNITNFMISELEKICEIIEKEKNEDNSENPENPKDAENPQNSENLTILKDLKSKFSENKNINYFFQMKNKIKEECRIYSTIDKMRNYKKTISSQIKELRKKEPTIKNVENSKEILNAKSNFGNFILKSSIDYKVSDDNRINVQNLQTQILLMEKFIYNSSKTFNNTLLELKSVKKNLLIKIKNTNLRLESIYRVLGKNEGFFDFCFFERIEDSEKFLEIGEEEILEFMKEMDLKEKMEKRGVYGGMDDDDKSEISANSEKLDKLEKTEKPRKGRVCNINSKKLTNIQKIQQIKLISEKKILKATLKSEIEEFDRNVDWAIEERVKLKYELKMAEMKILELYKDLLEIQIYETQDNSLLTELFEQREILKSWNEKKTTNATKLKKLEKKEQTAKSELDAISQKYREKVFPNEIEKSDFVYKYYKKHYKGNSEKENLMELDNSEDLEMMNSGLENEKKEWVLTVEQNDEWLELLKKKRNSENTIRYFREDKVLLENECGKIEEKIGGCQKNLNKIKNSLDLLQTRKMRKINKLQSSFILSLDQIFSKLPLDNLQNIVMFTEDQFMSLNKRILELKNQCEFIDKEKLNLIKSQESLIKELGLLRFSKKKAQDELKENFHLKFGKVIDLKILDTLKQTKRLKELKIKLKEIEKNSQKKIEDFKISQLKTKNDLYNLKKKNTGIIKKITLLGSTQLKLNKTLDSTNKHIFKNEDNSNKENVVNYRRDLLSIIKLLNNELDELKKEIMVLKNKGSF